MKIITTTLAILCFLAFQVGCESIQTASLSVKSTPSVVEKAHYWDGRYYKKGTPAQCAAWVGEVMKSVGKTPPELHQRCVKWLSWGSPSSVKTIRPGDVVVYAKNGKYNHIAIYIGDGKVIHRPTYRTAVAKISLTYRRIIGVRRPPPDKWRAAPSTKKPNNSSNAQYPTLGEALQELVDGIQEDLEELHEQGAERRESMGLPEMKPRDPDKAVSKVRKK